MNIGFIGAGNMATAMMEGMLRGGVAATTLHAYDLSEARMRAMRALGVAVADSIDALLAESAVVVLAVKPKHLPELLAQLRQMASVPDVLSVAVGWTQAMLADALPNARGILRCMPNTPAAVGEAVIALCEEHTLAQPAYDALVGALSACGRVVSVPEAQMDAVTGISGSGPAYVYMFIEAMADAGVRQGLPRDLAYTLAAQTVAGAGKMVLETGTHPGALKDAVTSPGGTTIEAVYALEKAGFRGAVMDAVDACARKAAKMAKKQRRESR